ncbi:MAG: hypothetical protein LBS03_03235 [Bacteroidales bacterium]|jgi:hypothetical protein|nr:hypothetical protein [Bacteroidales bacterium]
MKAYQKFFLAFMAAVLVSCGSDSEEELIGNWVRIGEFGGPGRSYTATFVIDNVGYVCGGWNGTKYLRRDMWKLVVTNGEGKWYDTGDSLPAGMERRNAVGFSVNGKGYIGTGWDGDEKVMNDFWEYDPEKSVDLDPSKLNPDGTSPAWRKVASLPAPARYEAVSFVINNVAYVGTGYTAGKDKEYKLDFWKFNAPDPTDSNDIGSWEQVESTGNKRGAAAAFVIGDWAYLCTGSNSSGQVYTLYRFNPNNPINERWQKLRDISSRIEDDDFDDEYGTNLMRTYAVAFTMKGTSGSEKGYIAIGSNSTTWEYEPPVFSGTTLISGDVWTQRTAFPLGSRTGAFAMSFKDLSARGDNLIFIGTGSQGTTTSREDVWQFDPEAENSTADD